MIEFRYQYFIFFIKADFVGIYLPFPKAFKSFPALA